MKAHTIGAGEDHGCWIQVDGAFDSEARGDWRSVLATEAWLHKEWPAGDDLPTPMAVRITMTVHRRIRERMGIYEGPYRNPAAATEETDADS